MDLLRSLPIGLYLEKPRTWLHGLDPRVKLAWLMSFLLAPLLAPPQWRIGLVVVLLGLNFSARIPFRVWKNQMGWLSLLAVLAFGITCLAPDGFAIDYQPRLDGLDPSLVPPQEYQYILWQKGRFLITRRSLDLGIRIGTLIFTLVYSTNLYLLTTASEEITAGLEEIFAPLRRWKLPITEILLTLTLSLRFIPLVLEEIQNLVRSVRTRAINWKKLGLKRSLKIWLMIVEKLLENLLLRAEQIAIAMEVRGFTSPDRHRVEWHQLRLTPWDWVILLSLIPFWWARLIFV